MTSTTKPFELILVSNHLKKSSHEMHPVERSFHISQVHLTSRENKNMQCNLKVKVGDEAAANVCLCVCRCRLSEEISTYPVALTFNKGDNVYFEAVYSDYSSRWSHLSEMHLTGHYIDDELPATVQTAIVSDDTTHLDQLTSEIKKKIIAQYLEGKVNSMTTAQEEGETKSDNKDVVPLTGNAQVESLYDIWKYKALSEYFNIEIKKITEKLNNDG